MKEKTGIWVWIAVAALLVVQAVQVFLVVRQESLTFDEGNHIFAGYMMWKTSDYGLNPEHPPLVKLLATSTVLGENLTVPPLQGRFFKLEAYLTGRDFLAANDHDHHLLLRMRLAAGILALGMTLTIFFASREWFGTGAALIALVLVTFDPNLLAHSALVTTDMGLSCFMLLGILTFYRWATRPTLLRLLAAGLAAGCEIGSKHSGILLAPMLIVLALLEVLRAGRGERRQTAIRMLGGLTAIVLVAVGVLWSLYGFRYAARPAGLPMSVSVADYAVPLSSFSRGVVLWMANWHLLPESYLIGLVDVKLVAQGSPTFLLGKLYTHGVWWYFPTAIAIKTTLGMLLLGVHGVGAVVAGKLRQWREVLYVTLPAMIYLMVAMTSGLNIGARHILPLWVLTAVLAGAGAIALIRADRRWAYAVGALVLFHVGSALADYPSYMAYANEAWGGPPNVHTLLSDANADWAQQLIHVRQWQDQHPGEDCWFAYFAQPEIDPAAYGITCHPLPTTDTGWFGFKTDVSTSVRGAVMISAGVLSACELPSNQMSGYRNFAQRKPDEQIDHGVMVYRGEFAIPEVAALSLSQDSAALRREGKNDEALEAAQKAVALAPDWLVSLTALANAQNAAGDKAAAKLTYQKAIIAAKQLEPEAQVFYLPELEEHLSKL